MSKIGFSKTNRSRSPENTDGKNWKASGKPNTQSSYRSASIMRKIEAI